MQDLPSFVVYIGGRTLSFRSAKYRQSANDALTIESTTREDQGIYTCTADNGIGIPAIKRITLQIYGAL